MIIPTIYSIVMLAMHTNQYDTILTNIAEANRINLIAKNEIPNELWEIVCGKKEILQADQYIMVKQLKNGIELMQGKTKSRENLENLEVASRVCTTLSRNILILEEQIENGSTVSQNEAQLEEIRTITSLFSDIMENYILSEIKSANITNMAIKRSSITLTILQIIIITLSLIVSFYSYYSFSQMVGEPLKNMSQLSSEIAQGNLNARTIIPDVTELDPLANNMNIMAEQISVLIQKNIQEQKNFQKAEMKALQAQITPHFLYNTFDTIIWLAEEEDTQRVVTITKAFSEFLRISLSKGHEWITIGQELDHIRNYLTIQKIRYADILNYEIKVDDSLNSFKMIKLILQPLVENAIYHGIKNKRGRGHIEVTVHYTDESKQFIQFSVKDNGAGFTEERLKEVLAELNNAANDSEKLSSVYGLYNVHKKLCLYYGNKTTGLKIESEHLKGTTISFVIPCIVEEENV